MKAILVFAFLVLPNMGLAYPTRVQLPKQQKPVVYVPWKDSNGKFHLVPVYHPQRVAYNTLPEPPMLPLVPTNGQSEPDIPVNPAVKRPMNGPPGFMGVGSVQGQMRQTDSNSAMMDRMPQGQNNMGFGGQNQQPSSQKEMENINRAMDEQMGFTGQSRPASQMGFHDDSQMGLPTGGQMQSANDGFRGQTAYGQSSATSQQRFQHHFQSQSTSQSQSASGHFTSSSSSSSNQPSYNQDQMDNQMNSGSLGNNQQNPMNMDNSQQSQMGSHINGGSNQQGQMGNGQSHIGFPQSNNEQGQTGSNMDAGMGSQHSGGFQQVPMGNQNTGGFEGDNNQPSQMGSQNIADGSPGSNRQSQMGSQMNYNSQQGQMGGQMNPAGSQSSHQRHQMEHMENQMNAGIPQDSDLQGQMGNQMSDGQASDQSDHFSTLPQEGDCNEIGEFVSDSTDSRYFYFCVPGGIKLDEATKTYIPTLEKVRMMCAPGTQFHRDYDKMYSPCW